MWQESKKTINTYLCVELPKPSKYANTLLVGRHGAVSYRGNFVIFTDEACSRVFAERSKRKLAKPVHEGEAVYSYCYVFLNESEKTRAAELVFPFETVAEQITAADSRWI